MPAPLWPGAPAVCGPTSALCPAAWSPVPVGATATRATPAPGETLCDDVLPVLGLTVTDAAQALSSVTGSSASRLKSASEQVKHPDDCSQAHPLDACVTHPGAAHSQINCSKKQERLPPLMNGKSANFNLKNEAIYSKIAPNAAEKRLWGCGRAIFQVFLRYFYDEKWPYRLFIRR